MSSTRQKKIASVLQQDLAEIFQQLAKREFPGTLITVSKVRVTPDLGMMRAYLSVFPSDRGEKVMEYVAHAQGSIRKELGQRVRHQLRIVPELYYHLDDSLDYEENIDRLLREGGENPIQ